MRLLNLLPGTARVFIAAAVLITGTPCRGQNTGKLTAPSSTERTDDSLLGLHKQLIELKSMLEEMRTDGVRARMERTELREQLDAAPQQRAAARAQAKAARHTVKAE